MIRRAFCYRIYPTEAQAERLREFAGAARFIYNLALEQRRDWWRQYKAKTGRSMTWQSQSLEVTALRNEALWLQQVPRTICEQSLRDLDSAFKAFYRGGGYPGFRSRDRHMSFRLPAKEARVRQLNDKWSELAMPHVAPLKVRLSRPIVGKVKNFTVQERAGRWFVAIACETEATAPAPARGAIGIDRGISTTLALSNGEQFTAPALQHIRRKLAQRAVAPIGCMSAAPTLHDGSVSRP